MVDFGHKNYDGAIQMTPVADGDQVIVLEETYKRDGNTVEHYYRVKRHPNSPSATVQFRVRARMFTTGIVHVATIRDRLRVKLVKRR